MDPALLQQLLGGGSEGDSEGSSSLRGLVQGGLGGVGSISSLTSSLG
jgi:hypothetical protein